MTYFTNQFKINFFFNFDGNFKQEFKPSLKPRFIPKYGGKFKAISTEQNMVQPIYRLFYLDGETLPDETKAEKYSNFADFLLKPRRRSAFF